MDVNKLDHQYCEWKKLTPPDKKSSLVEPMAKFVFAPESEKGKHSAKGYKNEHFKAFQLKHKYDPTWCLGSVRRSL